jgi:hypothetical protein
VDIILKKRQYQLKPQAKVYILLDESLYVHFCYTVLHMAKNILWSFVEHAVNKEVRKNGWIKCRLYLSGLRHLLFMFCHWAEQISNLLLDVFAKEVFDQSQLMLFATSQIYL